MEYGLPGLPGPGITRGLGKISQYLFFGDFSGEIVHFEGDMRNGAHKFSSAYTSCMEFKNLDTFRLIEHGDAREQEWWPLLAEPFPDYEIFWRRYIVPFTNRVNGSMPPQSHIWRRVRPGIPRQWERLAVSHYSVFYFAGRAFAKLRETGRLYPEDVVYLLETCGENASHFFDAVRDILGDFDLKVGLPQQYPRDFPETFQSISAYRNAMLHNPVLGRTERHGSEYLPVRAALQKVQKREFLWSAVEELDDSEFTEVRNLFTGYARKAVQYLNSRWEQIIALLDSKRNTEKFIRVFRASGIAEFAAAPAVHATFQSPAASGTNYVPKNHK
jgi:hypothetical protein